MMKLIHSHTIQTDYTGTFSSIYTNEIVPYLTFGDYRTIYICMFENNTLAVTNPIRCAFFSAAIAPTAMDSNTRNGGLVRGNYANIRTMNMTYDAMCSTGTVLKIYTIDI